jgi:4a-hydroxytetrahydrobiopterin dehydratase
MNTPREPGETDEHTAEPIAKGTLPLSQKEAEEFAREVPLWTPGTGAIEREFHFRAFREAMVFVNQVAALANEQDHHPDMFISYSKVRLTLSTHKINGLSLNDFIVAAKIDRLADQRRNGKAA